MAFVGDEEHILATSGPSLVYKYALLAVGKSWKYIKAIVVDL